MENTKTPQLMKPYSFWMQSNMWTSGDKKQYSSTFIWKTQQWVVVHKIFPHIISAEQFYVELFYRYDEKFDPLI